MSNKKKGKENNKGNHKGKQNANGNKFKVPNDVKEMASLTLKKFKKENDYYSGKKELKKGYYARLIDLLPTSINFIIRYGHMEVNKEIKEAIFEKLVDVKFIKALKKELDNDFTIDNIELLPNIISQIARDAAKAEAADKENGNELVIDLTDLIGLSRSILKKKIKKLTKIGVDENMAFDILSIIPTNKILEKSPYFHIRMLFLTLYEHAKTKSIDFGKILKVVIKDDKYITGVVSFGLLERKDKITSLTAEQITLFNTITNFCCDKLESMDKDTIKVVVQTYIQARQKDEQAGRDANRRIYLSSLPQEDYPKILKVVTKMIKDNEANKKYL